MRQLAVVLTVLAGVAFAVGTYAAFTGTLVVGKQAVMYWRGAIGFLLFALTLLGLDRTAPRR
ncbi:MAG: hypothetical protein V1750_08035 [Acidobacteriota bacterium]